MSAHILKERLRTEATRSLIVTVGSRLLLSLGHPPARLGAPLFPSLEPAGSSADLKTARRQGPNDHRDRWPESRLGENRAVSNNGPGRDGCPGSTLNGGMPVLERVVKVTAVQVDAAAKIKDKIKKKAKAMDDALDAFVQARDPMSRTDKKFSDAVDKFIGAVGTLVYDYADAEIARAKRIQELAAAAKSNAQKRVLKAKAK